MKEAKAGHPFFQVAGHGQIGVSGIEEAPETGPVKGQVNGHADAESDQEAGQAAERVPRGAVALPVPQEKNKEGRGEDRELPGEEGNPQEEPGQGGPAPAQSLVQSQQQSGNGNNVRKCHIP